jgi:hypothetical protein
MTLYRPGLLGLSLLHEHLNGDRRASALALIVRLHREDGLPVPITPSRMAAILDDADAWLLAQAEAGTDPAPAELAEAVAALNATPTPAADRVPPPPSQS